jgi:hypothetical protein
MENSILHVIFLASNCSFLDTYSNLVIKSIQPFSNILAFSHQLDPHSIIFIVCGGATCNF